MFDNLTMQDYNHKKERVIIWKMIVLKCIMQSAIKLYLNTKKETYKCVGGTADGSFTVGNSCRIKRYFKYCRDACSERNDNNGDCYFCQNPCSDNQPYNGFKIEII